MLLGLGCARRPQAYWFRAPVLSGVFVEVLPEPPWPESSSGTSSLLLASVGDRTRDPPLAFALRTVRELGLRLAPAVSEIADPQALLVEARARGALAKDLAPAHGDLALFEDGSLVGVVVSQKENGAVEFVYVQGGIVRRGFVYPPTPTQRRDPRGRILNTFVRPFRTADRRGQKYLAGELLYGYVRVDRLRD